MLMLALLRYVPKNPWCTLKTAGAAKTAAQRETYQSVTMRVHDILINLHFIWYRAKVTQWHKNGKRKIPADIVAQHQWTLIHLANPDQDSVLLCLKSNTFWFMHLFWWGKYNDDDVFSTIVCMCAVVREVNVPNSDQQDSHNRSVWQAQRPPSSPSPSSWFPFLPLSLQPRPIYTQERDT